MAQWNIKSQSFPGQDTSRFETFVQADQYGRLITPGATSVSAFGEPVSVTINPIIQLDALYGLDPFRFETFSGPTYAGGSNGSIQTTGTLFSANTGTGLFSYGVIRSRRTVRYRPGQGALCRFTAAFTANSTFGGPIGYTQRAGFFTQEQAIQVGYNTDGKFGVLRQNGGKAHIHKFEFLTPATGTGNITLRLNGTNHSIRVTAGTLAHNMAEIANSIRANTEITFIPENTANTLYILAPSIGPNTGSYGFTGAQNLTSSGNSISQEGNPDTNNWTYQSDFHHDPLDGTGSSGLILDPSKLNVYQINFRWLGVGKIEFAVEDPEHGHMIPFHHEHFSNETNAVHTDNPSFKMGYVSASLGGTGNNCIVTGASMMGAIEGEINQTTLTQSQVVAGEAGYAELLWHHGLTIHNKLIHRDKINTRELLLKNISFSGSGTFSGNISVALIYNLDPFNPNLTADIEYFELNEWSLATFSGTDSNFNSGFDIGFLRPVYSFGLNSGGVVSVNLEPLRIAIPPNVSVSVFFNPLAAGGGTLSRYAASLSWAED